MGPMAMSLAAFRTGMAGMQLMMETQAVIAMRLWGIAGLWAVAPSEATRMVTEKPPVLARAAMAATARALSGGRPDEVAAAWMAPVARRARSNRRRLSKRGPARRG